MQPSKPQGPLANIPWKHDGQGEYVFDSKQNMVIQIRGWGSLQKLGEGVAIEIQIELGDIIERLPLMIETLKIMATMKECRCCYKVDADQPHTPGCRLQGALGLDKT